MRDASGRVTGAWLPCRIAVERGLCDICISNVTSALNHLTGDVVELTTMLGHMGSALQTRVTSTPDLAVPINLGIEALRAEIDDELQKWAEPVAEVLGIEWNTTAMGRTSIFVRAQRAAVLLAKSVDVLLALPPQEHLAWEHGEPKVDPDMPGMQDTVVRDGIAGAIALYNLHRHAWAVGGHTEYVHRFGPLRCRRCGIPDLRRRNGEDFATCQNCHEIVPWELIPFTAKMQIDCERAMREEEARQAVA